MQKFNDKYMSTIKIGPKGQIVIPKEVRDMFSLKPGDSLVLLADSEKGIAIQSPQYLSGIADAIFQGRQEPVFTGTTKEQDRRFAALLEKELNGDEINDGTEG